MNYLPRFKSLAKILPVSILAGVVAFIASRAQAQVADTAIVKIESGLCSHVDRNFHGSGTIFKTDQGYFVITSEHVVLHDNGKYCHQVSNSALGTLNAKLLVADWGMGLALLKITSTSTALEGMSGVSNLSALNAQAKDRDAVWVAGMPYSSRNLISDASGNVLAASSERNLIPLLNNVIELQNAHGEYGMSGGAVLRKSDRAFIGVLSHQIIQMVAGETSVVTDLKPGNLVQNHLIVIPAVTVQKWINSYFADPVHFRPSFVRDADQQYLNKEVILSSGLRFEMKNRNTAVNTGIGGDGAGVGGDGAGVGGDGAGVGGDGAGVGGDGAGVGGDGAGVGGDGNSAQTNLFRLLEVSLAKSDAKFTDPGQSKLLARINDLLNSRNRVQIPYLIIPLNDSRRFKRVEINSIDGFFHDLIFRNAAAKLEFKSLLPSTLGSVSDLLKTSGTSLKTTADVFLASVNLSVDAEQALTSIRLAGDLLATGETILVSENDLNAFLDLEKVWTELFGLNFDLAVEMRKSLIQALGALKRS